MQTLESEAARIFLEALEDHEPSRRDAFVHEAASGHPELLQRVCVLLKAHDQSNPMLQPGELLATADYTEPSERAGTMIGPYKLLEQIGEGGMGLVFVAEQSAPMRRKVALKVIKPGMDTRQVIARFEAERQALALMNHPNIATVLDAGTTDGGRPYFVMELVKGASITGYCDEHRLGVRDRLGLFLQVCSAVQHAHQKGVIHRDLKPSNVLVTVHDAAAAVKVIDFGIAKAVGRPLTDGTLYTGLAQLVGTPLYMSPEQAGGSGLDVDTRTDVYALGVVLYELLTGTTPFEKERLRSGGLDEFRRLVREEVPARPSERLSTLEAAARTTLAEGRASDPWKRAWELRGELDWVALKCLEKDRERRYESAAALAADVRRYLADEPVEARRPSVGYRLRKLARRNRGKVIAASLVLFALLAGVAGLTVGLFEARRQEAIAKRELKEKEQARQAEAEERAKADVARAEAQAKEAEANAVVKFFDEQVFAAARPKNQDGGLGAGVTLRDAIAASVPALEKGFVAQPLVEARLRNALGITFGYLAEYDQARDQCERARALYTRHRGPDHPSTLASMNNLALIYEALNRPADALKLREETLAIQKRVLPQDHPDTLLSMHTLANS